MTLRHEDEHLHVRDEGKKKNRDLGISHSFKVTRAEVGSEVGVRLSVAASSSQSRELLPSCSRSSRPGCEVSQIKPQALDFSWQTRPRVLCLLLEEALDLSKPLDVQMGRVESRGGKGDFDATELQAPHSPTHTIVSVKWLIMTLSPKFSGKSHVVAHLRAHKP